MESQQLESTGNWKSELFSFIRSLVLLLVVYFGIRTFIAQPFIVRGMSMETTLSDGDYLVVDELSYQFRDPERLEIVVFRTGFLGRSQTGSYYIKRLIGLPEERVVVDRDRVTIYNQENPQGFILDEPYLDPRNPNTIEEQIDITLRDNEFFVMGDNRSNSSDSRVWGPLDRRYIVGKPIVRLFPFNTMTLYTNETFSQASR